MCQNRERYRPDQSSAPGTIRSLPLAVLTRHAKKNDKDYSEFDGRGS